MILESWPRRGAVMILVEKRFPGEVHDVREFVQPNAYMVRRLADKLSDNGGDLAASSWRWIISNIRYPPGNLAYLDWHRRESFVAGRPFGKLVPLVRQDSYDFWQFPVETISLRTGDCEDTSILLCSLLRTRVPETEVFVTVGDYQGYGHAWVTYRGIVYDTSPGYATPAKEALPYRPWFRFNDRTIIEERS